MASRDAGFYTALGCGSESPSGVQGAYEKVERSILFKRLCVPQPSPASVLQSPVPLGCLSCVPHSTQARNILYGEGYSSDAVSLEKWPLKKLRALLSQEKKTELTTAGYFLLERE